jgi:hypothetical protein
MKPLKIYVDMDGVLANFFDRFKSLMPPDERRKNYRKYWEPFVDGKNFETLEPMPDLQLGLDFLNSMVCPVAILGSTARPDFYDELVKQKTIWLDKHNILYPRIFVPGKRCKQDYAADNYVLIDDTISNIEQWNEQGGIGIFHTSWEETINEFKNIFDDNQI